ncbi:MAG: hypothetical protein J6B98_03675 [Bacilli bacterium]|nr:hypothetical protein [Bacilli bacterium]
MSEEFNTKEYVIPDDNEFEEITEEDYKEDLTSFEQDVVPHEDNPLELIEERDQEKEVEKKKKETKSFKEKWNNYSKKKKFFIIILGILIIALIAVGIIFFMKKDEPEEKKKEDLVVVIEKDNYRYENGSLILLDSDDNEIGKYECENKSENNCRVAYQNNEDDFDEEQYIYEDGSELKFITPIINNTYAFIYDSKNEENGMVFLYDLSKNEVTEKYNSVKYYKIEDTEYLIIENDESNYGLFKVNEEGFEQLIDFKYDYLGIKKDEMISLSYLVALKDNKYLIVDENGKEVSKKIGDKIKSFNNKYIVVEDANGIYKVTDYRNNNLLKEEYNYIILQENFLVAVKDTNKVVIIDYNETNLQNKEITIPNTYYNKTYIYDENNKPVSSEEAFWIINNDSSVTIEYYKNETDVESNVVNIYEGLVSKNYEYISYFDGILYIYDDEAKTNLIGSYKCTNKNNVNSIDSIYDNCYLAKESSFSDNELSNSNKSLGYLPVINKRFIFINDTLDKNNLNIVLYDLQENKTLGSYLSVDAGIYDGSTTLSFVTNSNLSVIGKSSRKNKFGVINITKDNVSGLLDMKYDSIERIGDYFQVENAGGTYQLYDKTGEKVTEAVGNKIVNYTNGYIKTKEGEKYSIYSFDVESNSKKNLNYVDLKNNFFVTIDANKNLKIYEYSDFETVVGEFALEAEGVSYTYINTIKGSNGYSIEVADQNGEKITIPLGE